MKHFSLFALALAIAVPATATSILGNPDAGVVVIDGSDIYIHRIVLSPCQSGSDQTVTVGATLNQGQSVGATLPQGSFCSAEVELRWSPELDLVLVDIWGFTELDVSTSGDDVEIELDEATGTATLVYR